MAHPLNEDGTIKLTQHAERRLEERGILLEEVLFALEHGRRVWTRGAQVFVLGQKELVKLKPARASRLDGLQVVCSPDGDVLTVYRNKDLRGLRPRSRRPHFCQAA